MAAPIGPNGKGTILPGIDGGQGQMKPPFVQACGLSELINGPGDFLNKITPPSIVNMANINSLAILGKGPPSIVKNKGQAK